ncbi:MAG: hypothetical protein K2L13_00115, partial [Opitutales bacterium]|nr:hypothetical protein [Opitutales bacterium]
EWDNNSGKFTEIVKILTQRPRLSFGKSTQGIKEKLEEIYKNLEEIYKNLDEQDRNFNATDRSFFRFGQGGGSLYNRGLPPQVILGIIRPIQSFVEDQQTKVWNFLNQTLPNLEKLLPQETSPQNS